MKIVTVLGTRPEIIRLSAIIEKLDRHCHHVLINTGQNFDPALNEDVFRDLGVRKPDRELNLGSAQGFGEQTGAILAHCERALLAERPDRVLVLGDTNSGLAAVVGKRLGIEVHHLEAGNRCFDDRVPEEVNRRIIDHCSDVLMPYTERSRHNLLREGVRSDRIHVVGNPIGEVIERHAPAIGESRILDQLKVDPEAYFLATLHRAENVDLPDRLATLVESLTQLAMTHSIPVIISTHPRTRSMLEPSALRADDHHLRFLPPFGFFDFLKLEKSARCVLTDSGTVQEECCILGRRVVTLRDSTERPETIECGSNMLTGIDVQAILRAVAVTLDQPTDWAAPPEYLVPGVSSTVLKIVLGKGAVL